MRIKTGLYASGLLSALTLTSMTTGVYAQSEGTEEKVERLKVTGSRISRNDIEGVSPVTVLDREDIEKTGVTSVADLVGNLTQTSFGSLKEESGHTRSGAATSNLRGLGADKTLVLLDGRRVQAETSLGGADLNHIPIGIVERIEVLSDSASAIYGTDAIGGVINIITRDFTDGNTVQFSHSSPTKEGGGDRTSADYTFGSEIGKLRLLTGISVKKTVGILEDDRPFYNGSSTYSPWGSYVNKDGELTPHPECPEDRKVTVNGNEFCGRADGDRPYRIGYLEPDMQHVVGMTKFEYSFSPDLTLYGNLRYSYKESEYAALTTLFVDSQTLSAEYVDANLPSISDNTEDGTTFYRYIVDDFGHRQYKLKDSVASLTTGLKGYWNNYDWDIALDVNRSVADNNSSGQFDQVLVDSMIQSSNPSFDPINRQSALQQAQVSTFLKEKNSSQKLTMDLTGELGELGGGAIGFNVGLGFAREAYSSDMSDIGKELTEDGELRVSIPGGYGSGSRTVTSVYTEFLFPIHRKFEVNLAGRFDKYSDFGNTFNPKLGFAYRPLDMLLFRGSASTGFKAPSLDLVHQQGGGGFLSKVDQLLCDYEKSQADAGSSEPLSCEFPESFLRERVGNDDLKEETSKSFSLGMVFDYKNVNFSTDFYDVVVEDIIGLPDIDTILEKELNGQNDELISEGVIISRNDKREIIKIQVPYQNLGKQHVRGFDLNLNVKANTSFARILFSSNWNRTVFFKEKDFPTDPLVDQLDTEGRPKWRLKNQLNLGFGPHNVNLASNTIASMQKDNETILDDNSRVQERIPMYTSYDLQYAFTEFFDGSIAVGVHNIFDKQGGVDNSGNPQRRETVDQNLYSVRGRDVYLQLTQKF